MSSRASALAASGRLQDVQNASCRPRSSRRAIFFMLWRLVVR